MTLFTLAQARGWVPGSTVVGDENIAVSRVHTDTRTIAAGDLFVALKGERFDAHDFLAEAQGKGAVAAIAQRGLSATGVNGLQVPDSRLALGQLAAGWRAQYRLPLIAVTGSNGKTTVTQMIASILRASHGDDAFFTQGNFNNDIGVPLTLMRLAAHHRAGVVELGMNHPGEIAYLAGIAKPTVALVNNAQREHQEFMATVEAVARENGAVIASLSGSGTAVFPADEEFTPVWQTLSAGRATMTFALTGDADVTPATDAAGNTLAVWNDGKWNVTARTPAGPVVFELHVAGRHNVKNALAATACALAAGVSRAAIAQGLSGFEPVKGRSRAMSVKLQGGPLTLVDDTYNANPDSVRAAIDVLAELPGPRLVVLGDMGEVGDQGPAFHAEIGAHARDRGIEQVFTLGEQAANIAKAAGSAGRHFENDIDALNAAVLAALPGVRSLLVKGSRFMKMERVVQAVTASAQQQKEEDIHAA